MFKAARKPSGTAMKTLSRVPHMAISMVSTVGIQIVFR